MGGLCQSSPGEEPRSAAECNSTAQAYMVGHDRLVKPDRSKALKLYDLAGNLPATLDFGKEHSRNSVVSESLDYHVAARQHQQQLPSLPPSACCLALHRIITNLQNTLSEKHRPSKEMLLQPLPLDLMQSSNRDVKRTVSMTAATAKSRGRDNAEENAAPLPVGGVPSIIPPPLPAGFPATPTGAARQLQHLHVNSFGEKDSSNTGTSTGSGRTSVGPLRPSHLSIVSSNTSGVPSPASVVAAERLRDIQQVIGDGKKFETGGSERVQSMVFQLQHGGIVAVVVYQ